ncbi:MAG: sorbosone dehydrogenase family protein [Chloroflexi bacterium]|nr:MAG: sorbosone dehydrogenase family protein [Chloroflexota bacterium]
MTFRRQVNLAGMLGAGGVADITVPDGFTVNLFATGLNGPRFMAFGPDGVLYVADRRNDRIVRLPDEDGDGTADAIEVFADGLNSPHSLVFHENAWYVGIPNGVIRLTDTDGDYVADKRETLIDDYPTNGHSTRTVAFLPDGRMVVSVGSSCNVCEEEDPRRAAIVVYDGPEATNEQIFARGLRNAVGLAIHPITGELWATNNGRDLMGDDLPPETVYIVHEGANYGWPYCHSGHIEDPDMGFAGACEGVEPPIVEMQAHSAPLGLVFYTGQSFPATYQNGLFIAFHGSWNRSIPTGYKVVFLPLDDNEPSGPLMDFATGWLDEANDYTVYGRPVGLAVGPDGALYVSDDKGGFVYRIQYTGNGR